MFQKEALIEEKKFHAGVGEHIGYELGAKMVKDYANKYQKTGSQFVGRNILEQILAQPGCIGIKVFNAVNELGQDTIVYIGVNAEGDDLLNFTVVSPAGEMNSSEGIVADRTIGAGWFDITR